MKKKVVINYILFTQIKQNSEFEGTPYMGIDRNGMYHTLTMGMDRKYMNIDLDRVEVREQPSNAYHRQYR